jgi:RNA ligase
MPLAELLSLAEANRLPGGRVATGTEAEGFVLRFASGVRAKAKLAEYVRLHKVLTGVTERDIWRGHGIQRFAGLPAKQVAQALGCSAKDIEASGGRPLDALLEQVPDEFDAWVRGVIAGIEKQVGDRERAIDEAFRSLAHLVGDRGAFARATGALPDAALRPAMFLRLDGRPTELVKYRSARPEAYDPFKTDEENSPCPKYTS